MSRKYLAYKIPFASKNGTKREVRIYKDTDAINDPETIELLGGDKVCVTEENDSEDPYIPIRQQTGTIRVVDNADSGVLTGIIESLLPSNNISHPVKIIEYYGAGQEELVWQGFVNCESFSQDYKGVPYILEIPLNGVLEAMNSVQIGIDKGGVKKIRAMIGSAFDQIISDCGMANMIRYIYFSATCYNILDKYINMSMMYEEKEVINEDITTFITKGISCKEILSRLATFLGVVIREDADSIYFERIGEELGFYRQTYNTFKLSANNTTDYELEELKLSDFVEQGVGYHKWMGNTHNRTVNQGARSVAVVAKIEDYKSEFSLPDTPTTNLVQSQIDTDLYVNTLEDFDSRCECRRVDATLTLGGTYDLALSINNYIPRPYPTYIDSYLLNYYYSGEDKLRSDYYDYVINSYYVPSQSYTKYAYAMFCVWKDKNNEQKRGLLLSGFPTNWLNPNFNTIIANGENGYIYKEETKNPIVVSNGSLVLNISSARGVALPFGIYSSEKTDRCTQAGLIVAVKFGNKWWNPQNNNWQDTFYEFDALLGDISSTGNITIPITSRMEGTIGLYIAPYIGGNQQIYIETGTDDNGNVTKSYLNYFTPYIDLLITNISLKYKPDENLVNNTGDENRYMQLLGTFFSKEVEINTDMASSMFNTLSPTLIYNDETIVDPLVKLPYILDFRGLSTEDRRPEKDLLNRLAKYYSKIRRRLDLDINTHYSLPYTIVKGLEETPIHYLPLAQSVDWVNDIAKLTCIEIPNENE